MTASFLTLPNVSFIIFCDLMLYNLWNC